MDGSDVNMSCSSQNNAVPDCMHRLAVLCVIVTKDLAQFLGTSAGKAPSALVHEHIAVSYMVIRPLEGAIALTSAPLTTDRCRLCLCSSPGLLKVLPCCPASQS